MKSAVVSPEPVNAGFQIAPMIDVVFVIMLFFMVMASSVKTERELRFALPGISPVTLEGQPDEIEIRIEEDGYITMNEESFDSPQQKKLPGLSLILHRLAEDSKARNTEVLVTVRAEEWARYERIVDVLNATAKAGFKNVTLTVQPAE